MAKQINLLDLSVEELMQPSKTRDEKRAMIEYFRNLQNSQNQAIEMAATQQISVECKCNHGTAVATNGEQHPSGSPANEDADQVIFVPATSWIDLQPFRTLAKLSLTDWLLVIIAILLLVNIIRKK